jgi:hypothetical protein
MMIKFKFSNDKQNILTINKQRLYGGLFDFMIFNFNKYLQQT